MKKISVIGAGSWGTALAVLLDKNGHDVTIWSHRSSQIEMMENEHKSDKLKDVVLPSSLHYTTSLEKAVTGSELVLMAVPSTATREIASQIKEFVNNSQIIVTVTKGIEEKSLMTQTEILEDVLGNDFSICVLSGPSHAEEVVVFKPTLVVVGCKDINCAQSVQKIFMNDYFRVYTSYDVKGIEVGAALKNVIALAAGMADGIGFGDNCKAALITRGIKEISSLAVAMGGHAQTLSGLTGVGDLIVTCSSIHSRNRLAGFYMGQGLSSDEAMKKVNMIVEGAYSAKAALALSKKYNICMPIVEQVNLVLFENASVKDAVEALMTRAAKAELNLEEW